MSTIREKLLSSKYGNKTTYIAIVKSLISFYDNDHLPSITELAKSCNVSKSVITKFAQAIGYEGYVELQYSIKMEKKNLQNINLDSENKEYTHMFSDVKNYLLKYLNFFDECAEEIDSIADKLLDKEYKNINIFSSSSCKEIGYIFSQALNIKGIHNLFFSNKLYEGMQLKNITDNDLVVLILSDSLVDEFHYKIYEFIMEKTKNIILFVDSDKGNKYNTFLNKIITDRDGQAKGQTMYYQVVIQYLFIQIIHNIKCKIKDKKQVS